MVVVGSRARACESEKREDREIHTRRSTLEEHESMKAMKVPRLNMAIPRPASERMEMDFSTIFGMETFHLQK